jgi:hypothetical protein
MGGVRRLAAVGTVVVPLVVVVGVFAYGWLRDTVSGAGLSEDNRPAAVVLLSALGAAGWLLGSSILFAIHRSVSRLPRPARRWQRIPCGVRVSCGPAAPPGDSRRMCCLRPSPRYPWLG